MSGQETKPAKGWLQRSVGDEPYSRLQTYRKHIARGAQITSALAVVAGGILLRRPEKIWSGLVGSVSHAGWFVHASQKIPFLQKIREEKFSLGLSAFGLAATAPQLFNLLARGALYQRGIVGAAVAAFAISAVPHARQAAKNIVTGTWNKLSGLHHYVDPLGKMAEQKLHAIDKKVEHFLHEDPLGKGLVKHAPKALLLTAAFAQTAFGVISRDWMTTTSGATSIFAAAWLQVVAPAAVQSNPSTDRGQAQMAQLTEKQDEMPDSAPEIMPAVMDMPAAPVTPAASGPMPV